MRLVINTGFFNSFFDRADTFFRATVTTASTRRVISHLENVRNRTNNLSAGGANRLGGTLDIIQARINRENARLDAIGVVVNRAREFRRLTIDTDRSVEQEMQQLHGVFFEVNHWARPIIDLREDRQGFFAWLWGGATAAGNWIADRGRDAWNWVTGAGSWVGGRAMVARNHSFSSAVNENRILVASTADFWLMTGDSVSEGIANTPGLSSVGSGDFSAFLSGAAIGARIGFYLGLTVPLAGSKIGALAGGLVGGFISLGVSVFGRIFGR